MLNRLVGLARTDYVLVAAHLTDFTSDANLERLLREADRQNASVVAGATRQADGRWSHGCYQTSVNNYTLRYLAGYHRSRHECLLCDHVAGPFVARTDLLRRVRLAERTHLLSEDLFLRVRQADSRPVLVCPDVMFHVRRSPADGRTRTRWLSVTRRLGVDLVQPPGGAELRFSCRELRVKCDEGGRGRLMSPCCRRQLLRLIHAVMARCQETNAICELQEGTLLGALKMATILPWERDADIAFSSADFRKLENATYFFQEGFEWKFVSYPYCCHENRTSGGVVQVNGGHWRAELWGQHWTDTEKLRDESGQPPTRVLLDGRWYPAPRNPGLYVRNRYGREVYRHAEHWLTTGMESGWAAYNTDRFMPCPVAGHHSCLDQYLTDGVLQFDRP